MSKKRKFEIQDLDPAKEAPAQDEGPAKIPFTHWFDRQVKGGRLKPHQDEALLVFFKKQGLRNLEIEDVYNRALQRF